MSNASRLALYTPDGNPRQWDRYCIKVPKTSWKIRVCVFIDGPATLQTEQGVSEIATWQLVIGAEVSD